MAAPVTPAATSGSRWTWLVYLGIAVALIAAAMVAFKYFHGQELLKQAIDWVGQPGPWGPIIFIAIYVLATALFIPASVLTLSAGAVFGVVWGSVYISFSSTLGATCAFLIGRYLARDAIARKLEGNERFAAIDKAVAGEG